MSLFGHIRSSTETLAALFGVASVAAGMWRRSLDAEKLALALGSRDDAVRLMDMVQRVAEDEAFVSPNVTVSQRIRQYVDALHDAARRGEQMPQCDDDLRRMPEAVRWRAEDMAKLGGAPW